MPAELNKVFGGDVGPLIARMREGTPVRALSDIASNLRLSPGMLLEALRLSRETAEIDGMLSPLAQDRLFRAEAAFFEAVDVIGDADYARKWLTGEVRALGFARPLELLDTQAGYELVLNTLGQIKYGIVA